VQGRGHGREFIGQGRHLEDHVRRRKDDACEGQRKKKERRVGPRRIRRICVGTRAEEGHHVGALPCPEAEPDSQTQHKQQ